MVKSHRWAGVRNRGREVGDIPDVVIEREPDSLGDGEAVGPEGANESDAQASGSRHELAHGDVKTAHGALRVTLQRNSSQIMTVTSAKARTSKLVPRLLNTADSIRHATVHLANPDQPHALVMDMPRLGIRRPEALGDPDHDVLIREVARHPFA